MYFLVALALALISACVWYFFRSKKQLHLEILPITYGAATLMWLIDCIASAIKGEGFLSFNEIELDLWISLWTFLAGLVFWGCITLILYLVDKKKKQAA